MKHFDRSQTSFSEIVSGVLAVVLTLSVTSLVLIMCFVDLPEGAHDPLMFLAGTITTGWLMVLSYYFGSSADVEVSRRQTRDRDDP